MYAKVVNGAVTQYPYTHADFVADHPDTSFPSPLNDQIRADFGMVRVVIRVALPPSTAQYATAGKFRIERAVPLPDGIKPGKYELHNTLRWRANPLREQTVLLPVLVVDIP